MDGPVAGRCVWQVTGQMSMICLCQSVKRGGGGGGGGGGLPFCVRVGRWRAGGWNGTGGRRTRPVAVTPIA